MQSVREHRRSWSQRLQRPAWARPGALLIISGRWRRRRQKGGRRGKRRRRRRLAKKEPGGRKQEHIGGKEHPVRAPEQGSSSPRPFTATGWLPAGCLSAGCWLPEPSRLLKPHDRCDEMEMATEEKRVCWRFGSHPGRRRRRRPGSAVESNECAHRSRSASPRVGGRWDYWRGRKEAMSERVHAHISLENWHSEWNRKERIFGNWVRHRRIFRWESRPWKRFPNFEWVPEKGAPTFLYFGQEEHEKKRFAPGSQSKT